MGGAGGGAQVEPCRRASRMPAHRHDGDASAEPARILHAPELDGYFADLEPLWAGAEPPSVDHERALMARHGMRPA